MNTDKTPTNSTDTEEVNTEVDQKVTPKNTSKDTEVSEKKTKETQEVTKENTSGLPKDAITTFSLKTHVSLEERFKAIKKEKGLKNLDETFGYLIGLHDNPPAPKVEIQEVEKEVIKEVEVEKEVVKEITKDLAPNEVVAILNEDQLDAMKQIQVNRLAKHRTKNPFAEVETYGEILIKGFFVPQRIENRDNGFFIGELK